MVLLPIKHDLSLYVTCQNVDHDTDIKTSKREVICMWLHAVLPTVQMGYVLFVSSCLPCWYICDISLTDYSVETKCIARLSGRYYMGR